MASPKILIVSGNGFNCERETSYVFEFCGGSPDIVHMNDILSGETKIAEYQVIAFLGGFSYGDHLGGGKVAANKLRFRLSEELQEFIRSDTLIIGICNGFQVITQMGILPGFSGNYDDHLYTLSPNNSMRYEDRWVHLKVNTNSPCVFTRNIRSLFVPVRHGEGKVTANDESVIKKILDSDQAPIYYIDPATDKPTDKYPYNPNGSAAAIAGICDPTGRIFGLMPHCEAYISPYNHPYWTRLKVEDKLPGEGEGVQIFRNAVQYFQ